MFRFVGLDEQYVPAMADILSKWHQVERTVDNRIVWTHGK